MYKDSAGNPTIGYGHLIKDGEDFSKGITKEKAGELLAQDTKTAVDAVNSKVTTSLSQTKFDAVVEIFHRSFPPRCMPTEAGKTSGPPMSSRTAIIPLAKQIELISAPDS